MSGRRRDRFRGRKIIVNVSVTTSCSGCYDGGEYDGRSYMYPYDTKARCRLGVGCHECGFTGKRRSRYWIPLEAVK